MASIYQGYVLKRKGRWRADLPGAATILFAVAFVVGLKPDIRKDLGVAVWGCLGAALIFGYLWRRGHRALQWQLTADEHGVRLENRAGKRIDLGIPKRVDHGRFSMLLTGGQARRLTPHVWVAIETIGGESVVFQRAMGALDSVPKHWPEGDPPRNTQVFSSLGFDPVAFLAAVVEHQPAAGGTNL